MIEDDPNSISTRRLSDHYYNQFRILLIEDPEFGYNCVQVIGHSCSIKSYCKDHMPPFVKETEPY